MPFPYNWVNVRTNPFIYLGVRILQDNTCGDSLKFEILDLWYWSTMGLIDPVQTEDGFVFLGLKGDVNLDCTVNVLDVVPSVNIILQKQPIPTECELWAADCSKDKIVTVQDLTSIVNAIIGIGTCPP